MDSATAGISGQLLEQALLAHQQGRLSEAVRLYQHILQQSADHPVVLTNLASVLTRLQQYDSALALYQKRLQGGKISPEVWFNYGNLQQKIGLHSDAAASFQEALRLQPDLYPAHYNLANVWRDLGQHDLAIQHYQAALVLQPQLLLAHRNLGNLYRQLGRYEQAIAHHRQALLQPRQSEQQRGENCYNLANALADARQVAEAVHYYRQATCLLQDPAEAWINLGNLLQQGEHSEEAASCFRTALQWRRESLSVWLHLLRLYLAQKRFQEMADVLREAFALWPDQVELLRLQGDLLYQREEMEAALQVYQRLEVLQPGMAGTANALGVVWRALGDTVQAEAAWRRCLRIDPCHVVALANLGTLYRLKKRHEEGLWYLRQAVRLGPDDPDSMASLACTLIDLGLISEAMVQMEPVLQRHPEHADLLGMQAFALVQQARIREGQQVLAKARQLKPDSLVAIGNTLFSALYDDMLDGEAQSRLHRELAAEVVRQVTPLPRRAVVRRRKCHIGYLSPDLRTHPVGLFIEPVLRHHDGDRFHVTCYALPHAADATTERLQGYVPRWRSLEGWKRERIVQQIEEDRIDVLIDLAGYTAGGRMDVMACRAAPVQVLFLGYPFSSGLGAIDYILADRQVIPDAESHLYSERVLRLQGSFLCYQRHGAPEVAPLPALRNGYITFGSFNNLPKLSSSCVSLWAGVLRAVPDARLLLKASSLGDAGTCALVWQRFAAEGIAVERILLRPASSAERYLVEYGDMDIALDPIPFNGGTTSCDTLWMGVPLVTLAGRGFMGRMGCSVLHTLGMSQWIATTVEEYVQIAVRLAADRVALAGIRAGLRERMSDSLLCAPAQYTADLESQLLRVCI
ncbi:MAG: tetratricopeptide repeat protein [Magnetococcales bacterium]|nr:tetratricopeptide repeat protein [Magnetococcales bacterium]MBF0115396.1 tetratricopeptide repeat protein [Magnetococcales bacterium]